MTTTVEVCACDFFKLNQFKLDTNFCVVCNRLFL